MQNSHSLLILISASLCTSTIALGFSAVVIHVSPLFWIFPMAFILTALSHISTIVLASMSKNDTSCNDRFAYLFSLRDLASSCALTILWFAALVIAMTLSALVSVGKLHARHGLWSVVLPCICAFVEIIIMVFIILLRHKERKRMLYAEKWKWRPGHGASSSCSQWR